MSFGYSVGDGILLVQLAWRTLQGARKACGEHDDLTREVASLHRVLQRLQKELANPDSLLNRADDDRRQELNEHGRGCERVLNVMNSIVTRYNKLSATKRSGKRIWQKIKFGNGEMKDLADIRLKLSAYTSAITMSLNLCSLGSQGRVEKQLFDIGGDLSGIRGKVDWIAATMTAMTARSGDGTIWTSYENDDKNFWRQLRRELVREGYHSSILHKHKGLLKDYVEELGRRGVFDQADSEENEEPDEDCQESVESEEDTLDITESEASEPDDSDLDPLLPNDNSGRPAGNAGLETALKPENPRIGPSPSHSVHVQLPDTGNPETSVPPIPLVELSTEGSSSADELPSKSDLPPSQAQISAAPSDKPVATPSMISRSVYMEEVLDEDFLPGAHPNCFIYDRSSEPFGDIQNVTLFSRVASQGSISNTTSSSSCQASDNVSKNNITDFMLLPSEPPETKVVPGLNKMLEQPSDSKILKEGVTLWQVDPLGPRLIRFEADGFTYILPSSKTWKGLMRLIRKVFPQVEYLDISSPNANHHLLGHANSVHLPEIWHELLPSSWSVTLRPRVIDFRLLEPQKFDEQSQSITSRIAKPTSGPLLVLQPIPLRPRAIPRADTSKACPHAAIPAFRPSAPPPMSPLARAHTFRARPSQGLRRAARLGPYGMASSVSFDEVGSDKTTSANISQNSYQSTQEYPCTGVIPPLTRAPSFQAGDRTRHTSPLRKDYAPRDSSKEDFYSSNGLIPPLPRASTFQSEDRIRGGSSLRKEVRSDSDAEVHGSIQSIPRTRKPPSLRRTAAFQSAAPPHLPRASTFQAGDRTRRSIRLRKEAISESSDEELDSSPRNTGAKYWS